MSSINFDNIWLLLIAVPLVIAFVIAFCIAVNKDNRNWHNVTSSVLHVLIAVLVAFSAAGTSVETVVTETHVYVLADVSYSANRNLGKIDEYIDGLQGNLPRNSELGIVCFGLDQEVITPMGEKVQSVRTAQVDQSGTDVVAALAYVGNLFSASRHASAKKRVVLITDGKQTDESDSGALRRAVSALNQDGVVVDAIYLDNNVRLGEAEAQITSVEYSETVYRNGAAEAVVQISSRYAATADVYLLRDGEQIASEPVSLKAGRNYVTFSLPTDSEGEYDYEVRLDAVGDNNPYDNVNYFTQKVVSKLKTLLVTGVREDGEMLAETMGENADITTCLLNENYSYDGPYTVFELCQYDQIVLSNVNLKLMNYCDMFVDSLISVVNDLGKSLITMGDLYMRAQADDATDSATQSALSKLAQKLPVDYINGARDQKLITFVFDASDSMMNNGRLVRAKEAAKTIIQSSIVTEKDSVAIVAFHGKKATPLSVTSLTAEGRENALKVIDNLETKHGTMISGGLEEAYTNVVSLTQYERQVVFMSDGMNSLSDPDTDVYAWAEALGNTPGVAVSVLDVGRSVGDKWDESWVEASNRLKEIARLGKGKYMLADSDSVLNDFVLPEISNDVGDAVVDGQRTSVKVEIAKSEVLEGIDELAYINGYINTGLRYSAKNVLTAEHKLTGNRTIKVPVYAYWTVGKGKVASFTSNLTDKPDGEGLGDESSYWLSQWYEDATANVFFKNVLTSNVPKERNDVPFSVSLNAQTGYCSLTVAPVEVKNDGVVYVRITRPDGTEELLDEDDVLFYASVYTTSFSTKEAGKYTVEVGYSYKGSSFTYSTYEYVSYLPEYDSFTLFEPAPLYTMLSGNGTVSEDGTLKIENDENSLDRRIVRLQIPLLIGAVVLFVVDIVIRKLRWEDIRSLFIKVNKGGKA